MFRCRTCDREYTEMPTRQTCQDQTCGGLVVEDKEE